jgi:hypothetical protein
MRDPESPGVKAPRPDSEETRTGADVRPRDVSREGRVSPLNAEPGDRASRARRARAARFVCAAAFVAGLACGPDEPVALPDSLLGVWTTNDAAYRDRSLEITRDAVSFRIKYAVIDRHPIEWMEERPGPDEDRLYVLHYTENEGYDATLELRYRSDPVPQLRIGNREIRWTRAAKR